MDRPIGSIMGNVLSSIPRRGTTSTGTTIKNHPDASFIILLCVAVMLLAACARTASSPTQPGGDTEAELTAETTEPATDTPAPTATDDEETGLYAIVTATALNVRSGPGTVYNRIGLVEQNDEVEVMGQALNCQWLQVTTPSGQIGWVSAAYLSYDWACDGVAEAEAPPTPQGAPTPTDAPTLAAADTPTFTPTATPNLTGADTPTFTPTTTPNLAGAETPRPTPTVVSIETPTPTPMDTPTLAVADTPTPTEMPTSDTPTPTEMPTSTSTPTVTDTPDLASAEPPTSTPAPTTPTVPPPDGEEDPAPDTGQEEAPETGPVAPD